MGNTQIGFYRIKSSSGCDSLSTTIKDYCYGSGITCAEGPSPLRDCDISKSTPVSSPLGNRSLYGKIRYNDEYRGGSNMPSSCLKRCPVALCQNESATARSFLRFNCSYDNISFQSSPCSFNRNVSGDDNKIFTSEQVSTGINPQNDIKVSHNYEDGIKPLGEKITINPRSMKTETNSFAINQKPIVGFNTNFDLRSDFNHPQAIGNMEDSLPPTGRGFPISQLIDSGVDMNSHADLPVPQNEGTEADLPVPQNEDGQADLPVSQNESAEANLPVPQNEDGQADLPVSQNESAEANLPVPQNEDGQADLPVSQNEGTEADLPVPQNEDGQADLPVSQNERAEANLPVPQNENGQADLPVSQNESAEANLPVPQNEDGQADLPVSQNESVQADLPVPKNESIRVDLPARKTPHRGLGVHKVFNPTVANHTVPKNITLIKPEPRHVTARTVQTEPYEPPKKSRPSKDAPTQTAIGVHTELQTHMILTTPTTPNKIRARHHDVGSWFYKSPPHSFPTQTEPVCYLPPHNETLHCPLQQRQDHCDRSCQITCSSDHMCQSTQVTGSNIGSSTCLEYQQDCDYPGYMNYDF